MPELTNAENDFTIGLVDSEGQYRPVIMWNLEIQSYISEKDHPFRAYGCLVKLQGRQDHLKTFKVWIKESDFHKFSATRSAIMDQTHGWKILFQYVIILQLNYFKMTIFN